MTTKNTATTKEAEKMEEQFKEIWELFAGRCHKTAQDKGWWDEPETFAGHIALMHSELSEALEYHRNGNGSSDHIPAFSGIEEEFADTVIRVMDNAVERDLDVAGAIIAKMHFNMTREKKHGGKAY